FGVRRPGSGRHRQAPVRRSAQVRPPGRRRGRDGRADGRGSAAEEDRLPLAWPRPAALESLAQLLRLTGQPEFWLLASRSRRAAGRPCSCCASADFAASSPAPAGCAPGSNSWTAGQALQGQEDSVVKEKADTPLEQDLSIFHTPGGRGTWSQHPPRRRPAPRRRSAALHRGPLLDSQTASAAVAAYRYDCGHFAETDSLVLGPERRNEHEPLYEPVYEPSMMQSVLFDSPSDEMRSLQQQQQQQQQAAGTCFPPGRQQTMRRSSILARPGAGSWSGAAASMESLADDAGSSLPLAAGRAQAAAPEEAEELSCPGLSGSNRAKGGGSGGAAARSKEAGRGLATYEHSWRIATAGVCAVCEARQSRVCLLVCRGLPPDGAQRRCLSLPDGALLARQWQAKPPAALLQPLPLPPTAASPARHITAAAPFSIPGSPLRTPGRSQRGALQRPEKLRRKRRGGTLPRNFSK
uniref:SH2 domain-containing protein n=1 Tax=Macrostomum lignano TaxID=282301 RepID=A0A1I8FLG1_9PLAT